MVLESGSHPKYSIMAESPKPAHGQEFNRSNRWSSISVPEPRASSSAPPLSLPILRPMPALAPWPSRNFTESAKPKSPRLKARYTLATVKLALSKYRNAIRAVEPDHLVLRPRKMRSGQRFSYLALRRAMSLIERETHLAGLVEKDFEARAWCAERLSKPNHQPVARKEAATLKMGRRFLLPGINDQSLFLLPEKYRTPRARSTSHTIRSKTFVECVCVLSDRSSTFPLP
jgi:hypothetical protein